MTSRRIAFSLLVPAAAVLAACSSSTSGAGSTAAPGSASGGAGSGAATSSTSAAPGSSAASSAAPSTTTNPEALAAMLQRGLASTQSAHISLNVTTGGQAITGTGDEKLNSGKLVALQLSETIPGSGDLTLIQVDGKTYAKLPSTLNTSGKPYVLVTTSSSNTTVRSLATSLQSTQSSASVGNAGVFAAAASSIKVVGTTTVGGVMATHYAVVVDPTKLPGDYPGRSALTQAGIASLPVDLYVDGQGRPVEVTENLTVSGSTVSTKFLVNNYNKPVTITAPPASQVSTQ